MEVNGEYEFIVWVFILDFVVFLDVGREVSLLNYVIKIYIFDFFNSCF